MFMDNNTNPNTRNLYRENILGVDTMKANRIKWTNRMALRCLRSIETANAYTEITSKQSENANKRYCETNDLDCMDKTNQVQPDKDPSICDMELTINIPQFQIPDIMNNLNAIDPVSLLKNGIGQIISCKITN